MEMLVKKSSNEKTTSMIFGIVAIVILNLLCYVIGCIVATSDWCTEILRENDSAFYIEEDGLSFFLQALSLIVPIIIYCVAFNTIYSREDTKFTFNKTDTGSPFVYQNWVLFAILAGVLVLLTAFIIYIFAFDFDMFLIKPVMIWVWAGQAVLSIVVFFIPLFKPLKVHKF